MNPEDRCGNRECTTCYPVRTREPSRFDREFFRSPIMSPSQVRRAENERRQARLYAGAFDVDIVDVASLYPSSITNSLKDLLKGDSMNTNNGYIDIHLAGPDHQKGKAQTTKEYGVVFPDGTIEWGNYNQQLRSDITTKATRKAAKGVFKQQQASINAAPAKLEFVKRTITASYSEAERVGKVVTPAAKSGVTPKK